jgi:crossover junction endodeoxyribonuclease RusA
VTVTLPYPPTTNHAYLVARGRKVKTQVARDYAHEVMWRVADEMRVDPDGGWPTSDDRLAVRVQVFMPDRRRRDLENTTKLCLDAVCKQLGIDDSQIDRLTLERAPVDRQNPRLVLTLEALT